MPVPVGAGAGFGADVCVLLLWMVESYGGELKTVK